MIMTAEIDPRDEAYQCFLQEALEHLQVLECGLLNIQQESDTRSIHNLMRAAHSLKGGSALFGLSEIQTLAHNLENVFKILYRLEKKVDPELEELLLQAYDCLRTPLLDQLEKGSCNGAPFLEQGNSLFERIEAKLGHSLEDRLSMPELDITADSRNVVLSGLLEQELSNFSALIDRLDSTTESAARLESQCLALIDLGQTVNMPNLVASAQATIEVLKANPESAPIIAELALADLRNILEHICDDGKQPAEVAPKAELINFKESSPQSPEKPKPNPQNLGIRVDLTRLDNLNTLIGDLVTQENTIFLENQQHKVITDRLSKYAKDFQQLTSNLQDEPTQILNKDQARLASAILASLPNTSHPRWQIWAQKIVEKITQKIVTNLTQELSEKSTKLQEITQDLNSLNQQGKQIIKKRQQTLKQVQSSLTNMRMIPCDQLLNQFPRMVRDFSAKYNKQVTLKLTGTNTLIDKAILEKLSDPLLHLVRNAFDHGIEKPEVRQIQGKNPQGTIEIATYHRGNHTYIEVRDDGKGISLDKIKEKIVSLNWLSQTQVASLSSEQLCEYLFKPGFSTAEEVSALSGRGVGLDTVKLQVQNLKGLISVSSTPGVGTTFILRLPFTLTASQVFVFNVNNTVLAIPTENLLATVSVSAQEVKYQDSGVFYSWQDQLIPVVFNLKLPTYDSTSRSIFSSVDDIVPSSNNETETTIFIISNGSKTVGIKVEQIIMQEDLVIKSFSSLITPPPYLLGCTILGDSRLVPVLDGPALVDCWYKNQNTPASSFEAFEQPNVTVPTILVVDDSLTIRQNLSVILTKYGYEVIQAENGLDALEKLRQKRDVEAIICDIDMPTMNGIEFLGNYRLEFSQSYRPIIMLTSRDSDKYRHITKRLGATGYLTKPYLELDLLNTLRNCLPSLSNR